MSPRVSFFKFPLFTKATAKVYTRDVLTAKTAPEISVTLHIIGYID